MPHSRVRQQGFTLLELLVIIVVIGVMVSLLTIVLSSGREDAYTVQCASNLNDIFRIATMYDYKRRYPSSRIVHAHDSLQKLVDRFSRKCRPEMFVCPSSDAVKAVMGENGRFVLDAATNAYAWEDGSKRTAKFRPLGSDKFVDGYEDDDGKHSGHPRGMNVLSTDGSVSFWGLDRLEEDTGLPRGLVR